MSTVCTKSIQDTKCKAVLYVKSEGFGRCIHGFLKFFCPRSRYVCVYVSAPEAINYIHVILKLYNQVDKFVAFRNVTELSIHGCGLCNEARCDRNQSNKAMLAP